MELIVEKKDKKIYRDGDKRIKVFADDYKSCYVLNEALNFALLSEFSFNVPALLNVTKNGSHWELTTEYIDGISLEEELKAYPEKAEDIIREFTELHIEITSSKGPFLVRQRDLMHASIEKTGLNATTRYHLHTKLNNMPNNLYLCHGDFCLSNVIRSSNGKLYVLDWGRACAGNRTADVAQTYIDMVLLGHEKWAELYRKYYNEKTSKGDEYLEKWLPFVAAASYDSHDPASKPYLMSLIEKSWG